MDGRMRVPSAPASIEEDSTGQAAEESETTMTVKTKLSLKGAGRDAYLKLVTAFRVASLESDEQLEVAQRVMDQLLARGELNGGEEMYLDALSDLVVAHEDEVYAIEPLLLRLRLGQPAAPRAKEARPIHSLRGSSGHRLPTGGSTLA